jgi:hypothetical protein
MLVEQFTGTCYNFGFDTSASYAFGRNRLPILSLPPVDVRAIAATVRATVAAPYQEVTSRNIESIAGYLPINHILSYVQCFDLSIDVESDSSVYFPASSLLPAAVPGIFMAIYLHPPIYRCTIPKEYKLALVARRFEEYCVAVMSHPACSRSRNSSSCPFC